MPAYRSSAEAEIRDAVVARIRERRPNARIIHEINVSTYGPNRIDLIAVDREEIIAVEVKSAKDKLDRLPAQIESMKKCSHHVIAAIHEKFLVEQKSNDVSAHHEKNGEFFMRRIPDGITVCSHDVWVFPEKRRAMKSVEEGGYDGMERWTFPKATLERALPWSAINILWREELYDLCGMLRVSAARRSTMDEMASALRWHCTGKELTRGICGMLRARRCVEADPEIIEKIAA